MPNAYPIRSFAATALVAISLIGCSRTPTGPIVDASNHTEWRHFGGDPANSQYSALDQITREKVRDLEVAWIYRAGDARPDGRSQIQCNPIIIDSLLYGSTPGLNFFALHAATGEEIWRFDPFAGEDAAENLGVNRGVVYWENDQERRLLFPAGERLFSLDALTGIPDSVFGDGGSVSLKTGLGPGAEDLFVLLNTPGVVFEDLIIVGSRVNEGPAPAAPGHIRAFHVPTGELAWMFKTIPEPGEFGYETWPEDAWQRKGGANAWTGMSVDHERGWVFVPTGSAAFDFYGGDRHGENLFANTLLALDARTGQRIWHYQVVRHDLWDRDLPAAPNLVTIRRGGETVEAVAQITKSGHVWVFDRESGEPLFPVEEIEAPPSDLEGEQAWPVQRLPLEPPPFSRQVFAEEHISRISDTTYAFVKARFDQGLRTGRAFIPPSTEGTMIFPGFDGGGEWGGAAVDPESGILYINGNEMPWILTMVDLRYGRTAGARLYAYNCAVCHGAEREGDPQGVFPGLTAIGDTMTAEEINTQIINGKGIMPSFGHLPRGDVEQITAFLLGTEEAKDETFDPEELRYPYGHTGYNRFLDPHGYPAIEPPWGTLNAIDLNRGKILWQVPLGEFPELTAQGIPKTGTENYGGPLVTAGNLIFIGASRDEYFRAFDKETGEELWKSKLPAGGYATPATYMLDGKQYVVIAAGGGKMGTKSGDAYVAYTLRE